MMIASAETVNSMTSRHRADSAHVIVIIVVIIIISIIMEAILHSVIPRYVGGTACRTLKQRVGGQSPVFDIVVVVVVVVSQGRCRRPQYAITRSDRC